jgi:glycosyltransferase involved in cell wall biosynthesis
MSYDDARIRYIKNEDNLKLIATLNKGLDLAQGKYIARMDADDVSLPERLERQVDFLEKNQSIGLLGTWVRTLGLEKDYDVQFVQGHDAIRLKLFFSNYFHHPTVIIRKSVLEKNLLKYPDLLHAEDYAFWLIISNFTELEIIPEILLLYRSHGENISELNKNFQKEQTSHCRRLQLKYLGIEINQNDFLTYEGFIDSGKINKPDQFSNLIRFIQSIILANYEKKIVNSDLLFNYYKNLITFYVELNCWQMGDELGVYIDSIFCISIKQKMKIKFKQQLGLKKLWN